MSRYPNISAWIVSRPIDRCFGPRRLAQPVLLFRPVERGDERRYIALQIIKERFSHVSAQAVADQQIVEYVAM